MKNSDLHIFVLYFFAMIASIHSLVFASIQTLAVGLLLAVVGLIAEWNAKR